MGGGGKSHDLQVPNNGLSIHWIPSDRPIKLIGADQNKKTRKRDRIHVGEKKHSSRLFLRVINVNKVTNITVKNQSPTESIHWWKVINNRSKWDPLREKGSQLNLNLIASLWAITKD